MVSRIRLALASFVLVACSAAPVPLPAPPSVPPPAKVEASAPAQAPLEACGGPLLARLRHPVTVDAYVARGLPRLDTFVRRLTEVLESYRLLGGGQFRYSIIDAKSLEQFRAAQAAGLKEFTFAEGTRPVVRGFMGLAFEYGGEREAIAYLDPDRLDGLEYWIATKIRETRDKADHIRHRIGIVSQHDEIKLSEANLVPSKDARGDGPSIRGIFEQAFPNYPIEEVDLKGGASEIDRGLAGLIVTQPGRDYTDKELRRIDQFLMEGNKSLVVYASAVNVKSGDTSMRATLSTHNLDTLLSGYGVGMMKDVIFDGDSMRVSVQANVSVGMPSILVVRNDERAAEADRRLDDTFAGFFRAHQLTFPFASTLEIHPNKQPAAKMGIVARSTPGAWAETREPVLLRFGSPPRAKAPETRALAVEVEGMLRSAMGTGDGVDVPAVSKQRSRVLVVSSAQFLANPFVRAISGGGPMSRAPDTEMLEAVSMVYAKDYLTNTILSLQNMLDWMISDAELLDALRSSRR
jgi:hypothetical protein